MQLYPKARVIYGDREGVTFEQREYPSLLAAFRAVEYWLKPMEVDPLEEPTWWTARVYLEDEDTGEYGLWARWARHDAQTIERTF